MKMPRDIKESLEMLLITRTGGEEARKVWRLLPTSPGWTSAVGLAGTLRAVHGAEHQFFFALTRPSLQKSVQSSGKE